MTQKFYVKGMHCASCELYIRDKVLKVNGVRDCNISKNEQRLTIDGSNEVTTESLNNLLKDGGYEVSDKPFVSSSSNHSSLITGLAVASIITFIFFVFQKLNIVKLLNPETLSIPVIFVIGIVASLSTCMATIGGLVLSISSGFPQNKRVTPVIIFHLSRIIGFFILGGMLGLAGSMFTINKEVKQLVDILLFIVMVLIGLRLVGLDIFYSRKLLPLSTSMVVGNLLQKLKVGEVITMLVLGAATFFLPCGFTQSMQLYALTTGSFISGGMVMLTFALGTFPVIGLISFLSYRVTSMVFVYMSGFLIIMFALLNLYYSIII